MKLKRLSAGLLMLALLLTLFAFPAAATGETYTVTLPDGFIGYGECSTGTTFAMNTDYTFTLVDPGKKMKNFISVVAYAEFADGSICAAECVNVFDASTSTNTTFYWKLDARYITSDFTIKTFKADESSSQTLELTGDGTPDNPFQIGTELDLLKIMACSTSTLYETYRNYCFELIDNITFHTPIGINLAPIARNVASYSGFQRSTIGTSLQGFYGIFDGKGHTISGLNCLYVEDTASVIPNNNGTIKNLNLVTANSYAVRASTTDGAGNIHYPIKLSPLVASNYGSILDCHVEATVVSHLSGAPESPDIPLCLGMVAAINHANGTIGNCTVAGSLMQDGATTALHRVYAGMICGWNQGAVIRDCESNGSISKTDYTAGAFIGGIVGWNTQADASYPSSIVENCVNHANINAAASPDSTGRYLSVGGITGVTDGYGLGSSISNCLNDGEISTSETGSLQEHAGGITGTLGANSQISACYNIGNVTAHGTTDNRVGGLVGHIAGTNTISAAFSYVTVNLNLYAIGNIPDSATPTLTAVYSLASETDEDDMTLNASDFKAASLVSTLNDALGATDDPIFVAGDAYPIFAWLAAPASVDLMNEPGVVTAPAASVATVTAEAEGSTATITVNCEKACVVIAYDGTDYVCLNGTGSGTEYTFTADYTESTTTFTVAVRGDADGNGSINANDLSLFVNACNGDYSSFTYAAGVALLIGDTDGNNTMNANDLSTLVNVCNGSALDWLTD